MALSVHRKMISVLSIVAVAGLSYLLMAFTVQKYATDHIVQSQQTMAQTLQFSRVFSHKIAQTQQAVDQIAYVFSVAWMHNDADLLQDMLAPLSYEKNNVHVFVKDMGDDAEDLFLLYDQDSGEWNTVHVSSDLYAQWERLYQRKKGYWGKPSTQGNRHFIHYYSPIIQYGVVVGFATNSLNLKDVPAFLSATNHGVKISLLSKEGSFIVKHADFDRDLQISHHSRDDKNIFSPKSFNDKRSVFWWQESLQQPALLYVSVPIYEGFIVAYSLSDSQWESGLQGKNWVWFFGVLVCLILIFLMVGYGKHDELYYLAEHLKKRCFYFSYDLNGHIRHISDSVRSLLGYSSATCLSNTLDEPMNPLVIGKTHKSLTKMHDSHAVVLKHKNGSDRYMLLLRKGYKNAFGKITGIEGLAINITQEVNNLTRILNIAQHGMLMMTHSGEIMAMNDHAEKIFKVSESALLKASFVNVIVSEDRGRFSDYLHHLKDSTHNKVLEICITFHNQLTYIEMSLVFSDEKNKRMVFSVYDITERKYSEQILRRSERRYRRLVEGIQQEYFFYSRDSWGYYHYVSPSVSGVLGYSRSQFQQYNYQYLSASELNKSIRKRLNSSCNEPSESMYVCEFLHADGSTRIVEILEISTLDADQRIITIEGVVRDITQQRHNEEALCQARDQAEEAFSVKSRVLSHMSHELRTPLNGILGYTQLMQSDTILNESYRNKLKIITRCGKHLLNLLNNVLSASKLEQAPIELNEVDITIEDIMNDVRNIVYESADKKHLQLIFEINHLDKDSIHLDATRLLQVLVNLVDNAIKFTDDGGSVRVIFSQNNNRLYFAVKDTGVGIQAKDLSLIFKPFQQVNHDFSSSSAGLGLAISHHLVKVLGGELSVTSEVDQGSCFKFSVPLKRSVEERVSQLSSVPDNSSWVLDEYCYLQVLIVEPNASDRYILQSLLKKSGFLTICVDQGAQALQVLKKHDIDLILTDIDMPVMDGITLYQAIQCDVRLHKVKVFAVTADSSLQMRQAIDDAGFHACFIKPYSVVEIFRSIGQHLDVSYKNTDPFEPLIDQLEKIVNFVPEAVRQYLKQNLSMVLRSGDINGMGELVSEVKQRYGVSMLTQFLDQCWLECDLEKVELLMGVVTDNAG